VWTIGRPAAGLQLSGSVKAPEAPPIQTNSSASGGSGVSTTLTLSVHWVTLVGWPVSRLPLAPAARLTQDEEFLSFSSLSTPLREALMDGPMLESSPSTLIVSPFASQQSEPKTFVDSSPSACTLPDREALKVAGRAGGVKRLRRPIGGRGSRPHLVQRCCVGVPRPCRWRRRGVDRRLEDMKTAPSSA
jgi:hypothetical protein